jgi:hypothetical protein
MLPSTAPAPEAVRLATLARRTVLTSFRCDHERYLGHQYLLMAIPFGRISLESPADTIWSHLYTEAALLGVNLIQTQNPTSAELEITCSELSLTAYDLLFTRLLHGSIVLEVQYKLNGLTADLVSDHDSEFRSYGLYPQLNRLYTRLMKNTARKLFERYQHLPLRNH